MQRLRAVAEPRLQIERLSRRPGHKGRDYWTTMAGQPFRPVGEQSAIRLALP